MPAGWSALRLLYRNNGAPFLAQYRGRVFAIPFLDLEVFDVEVAQGHLLAPYGFWVAGGLDHHLGRIAAGNGNFAKGFRYGHLLLIFGYLYFLQGFGFGFNSCLQGLGWANVGAQLAYGKPFGNPFVALRHNGGLKGLAVIKN